MTFSRRLYIWWFLIRRIPIIPFLGIRVEDESDNSCITSIRRLWRNRNPFGITYFAALIAAGEMAAGTLIVQRFLELQEEGHKLGLVIAKCEADFKRPASGYVWFKCEDGDCIDKALYTWLYIDSNTPNKLFIHTISKGTNDKGKEVVTINIAWQFYKL